MGSRRKSEDPSSLDLLIDTMCNTLGGIVFIALTLALFSNSIKTQMADVEGETTVTRSGIEKTQLLIRQADLENALAIALASIKNTANSNTNGMRIVELQEKVDKMEDAITSTRSEIRAVSLLLESASDQLQEAAQLEKLNRDVQTAKEEREQLEKERQRPIRMPNLKERFGRRYAFVALSAGRVYLLHDFRSPLSYGERGYYSPHVNTTIIEGNQIIVCRDGAGVDCDSFAESSEMRMLGKNLNARREVLQIAVYPDSYAQFHKLRNVLVEKGIEYNWVPVSGPLVVGESSTTESQ